MKKFKYRVVYLTDDERQKTIFVETTDTTLIPFAITQKGIKNLKRIVSSEIVSDDTEINQPIIEQDNSITANHKDDPHEVEHGKMFLKFGILGKKYVINNKVFTLVKITEGAATIQYYGKMVQELVSRHTEVEEFHSNSHKKLLIHKEIKNDT